MATQFDPQYIMELMLDKLHTTPARLDATRLTGTAIHAAIGGLSALAVLLFLIHCAFVAYYNRNDKDDGTGERIFIFTQLGFYVVCLMVSDFFQGVAGALQATWAAEHAIKEGPLCTTQGVLFQTGSLGNAVFTCVIAVHTLFTLVLRRNFPYWVVLVIIGAAWVVILFLELAIPAIVQQPALGPYYGLSGPWCTITAGYPLASILIHYLPVLLSALLGIILYLAIFFYLRGNLVVQNSRVAFRFILPKANLWIGENPDEEYRQFLGNVAYKMLWYPVVHVTFNLPLVTVRLVAMNGTPVPFPVWIFAGSCASALGLANLIILVTTRKVIGPLPFMKRSTQTDTLVDDKPRPYKDFRESFMSKGSGPDLHTARSYNGTGAPASEWQDQHPKSADYARTLSGQAPTIVTQTQRFVAAHRPSGSIDSPIHAPGRPLWAEAQRGEPLSPLTGDIGARRNYSRRNSNPEANRLSDTTTLVDVDMESDDKTGTRQKMREADSIVGLYSQRTIKKQPTMDRGRTLTRTPGELPTNPSLSRVRDDSRSRGARLV